MFKIKPLEEKYKLEDLILQVDTRLLTISYLSKNCNNCCTFINQTIYKYVSRENCILEECPWRTIDHMAIKNAIN